MMMGVGVLAISAGFYLLAQSAIAVTNAGPGAIAVFWWFDWCCSRTCSWYDKDAFVYVWRVEEINSDDTGASGIGSGCIND